MTLPTAERLQGLLRGLLSARGLSPGRETLEARELWAAVEREAPRMRTPFDEKWFEHLLAAQASAASARAVDPLPAERVVDIGAGTAARTQDWGEAPDTTGFIGRTEELALLQHWVVNERCRVVAVLGMGGIGKTITAAMLAQILTPIFERVYWRSLRNAPPVTEWLAGAIAFLSDQRVVPPPSESERTTTLLQLLRTRRCLLALDNSETLFEPGQREVRYREGMDGYGRFLQLMGETSHQSCLVLTSREAPPELAVLGGEAHALELHGLGTAEAQALLANKQLFGDTPVWDSLVERYGGNGLALKIVAETIHQLYDGDVGAFLSNAIATYGTVFGGIRRLLDVQAARLSPTERDLLTRMAVEREPINLVELMADMAQRVARSSVIEAIETLRRRSFVEPAERGARFMLQSMVLEYVTDRLVETVADEIAHGEPVLLIEQALIKAQAKDHVRHTQERLIGRPILRRLNAESGEAETERRLIALLDTWRTRPAEEQDYGPGNVINLLRLLRGDLRSMDLSRLTIRQAYLQGEAQDASLVGARLSETILAEAFAYPTAVALSTDGAFVAAGLPSGEVRLWRVADRTLLLAVRGHSDLVHGVALSGDGRLLASGSFDGVVILWDAESGEALATLHGHRGTVWCVALSEDGRVLASGGADGTARLWEAPSGRPLATLHGHTGPVLGVALSRDGGLVASAGMDGTVRLWDGHSDAEAGPGGQLLATLHGHAGLVRTVAVSRDGHLVASGGLDETVRLWDAFNGRILRTINAHSGLVASVAVSADGRLLVGAGGKGTIRVWECPSGQLVAGLQGHDGPVLGLALSGDGAVLASGGMDGTMRLWESASGQLRATIQGYAGGVWRVNLSADGDLVASGSTDGTVRLWDARSGLILRTLHGHSGLVASVGLSGEGRLLASGGADETVRLWDVESGQPVATLNGHSGTVWSVALTSDGRLLVSGDGSDGMVRLWETGSGQLLATLAGHSGTVWSVAITGDGHLVASGGVDGTVRVWEAASGRALATLQGHNGPVYGVAISADGRLLASGGGDGTVRLWETGSGQPLAVLQGHTGTVWGVALTQDGELVASGGTDGAVRLWETGTGRLLATLPGHSATIWGVSVSADGRLVASGGYDGTVWLWDATSGTSLRTLRADRRYERLDITDMTGVTEAQRAALLALGAIEQAPPPIAN